MRRAQAILLVNSEKYKASVKDLTGFDKGYAFELKKRFQEIGIAGIITKKKKPKSLLTKGQIEEIKKVVSEKRPIAVGIRSDFWTTLVLAEYIKKKYNVVYKSRTSYQILFKKSGFTYHKPEKHYHSQNKTLVDKWDAEVAPKIREMLNDPNSIVLTGDEMILTTQTTTQRAWLPTNQAVLIESSNKREKRCVYGFLDIKTGQEYAFKSSHTNSFTTCKFLGKLAKMFPGKKITIVWDNASWHKSEIVKNFLEKNPTYSPEKNPQEHVWKAGRENVTHNKFIGDIDAATNDFIEYLNSTQFGYKFL